MTPSPSVGPAAAAASGAPPSRLRLGAVAVQPARGDKEGNIALAERHVADAAARGAELVALPEGFLEGYVVNEPDMTAARFRALAEPLDGPYVARFRALARAHGVWLLACFAEREGDAVYNTALLLAADGAVAGRYRKTHVQSGGDWRYYAPGDSLPVFATPWGPAGVMICYDRQFPEVPRALMRQGARLILNPSWGMFGDLNEAMLRTRAHENGVFVLFAHVRGALLLDPRGTVTARSLPGEPLLVHDVDLTEADTLRAGRGHLTDHLRPDLYAAPAP
jgi:predicted amidohydrolase